MRIAKPPANLSTKYKLFFSSGIVCPQVPTVVRRNYTADIEVFCNTSIFISGLIKTGSSVWIRTTRAHTPTYTTGQGRGSRLQTCTVK
jgi:hypothetical protein